jgi:hypothetical protein
MTGSCTIQHSWFEIQKAGLGVVAHRRARNDRQANKREREHQWKVAKGRGAVGLPLSQMKTIALISFLFTISNHGSWIQRVGAIAVTATPPNFPGIPGRLRDEHSGHYRMK